MLLELIKNYRLKTEELKSQGLRGEKANLIANNLKDSEKFKTVDINELLDLLKAANYTTHPLNKIGTTLDYIKRNNLYDSRQYKSILISISSSLETLKLENFNQVELDKLLERITKLEKSIEDNDSFVTDFPLINQIIRESNLAPIDIYNIMLEIDKLNKNTIGIDKVDNHTFALKLISKYGYNPDLTPYEEKLIETINIPDLEEKLEYLKGIPEYDFLKNPLEHHRFVLFLLAPLKNIKAIKELSENSNLNLEDIFVIFYFNKDYELPQVDAPQDYFYQIFEGTYETFVNNSKLLLTMGYDLDDVYQNSSVLFYMATDTLERNLNALKSYNIPVTNPIVLSLEDNNIEDKIDKFIELGLYDYIKKYPQTLLNKDKAFFHRIYYAKKNGLPIKRNYLLKTITSINGYSINEENYQDKVKTYSCPLLEEDYSSLENQKNIDISNIINILDTYYLKEENVYLIENTYISRNKVIRLLSKQSGFKIDRLLYAILKGVLLDKETFDNIVIEILNKFLENNLIGEEEVSLVLENLSVDNMNWGVLK